MSVSGFLATGNVADFLTNSPVETTKKLESVPKKDDALFSARSPSPSAQVRPKKEYLVARLKRQSQKEIDDRRLRHSLYPNRTKIKELEFKAEKIKKEIVNKKKLAEIKRLQDAYDVINFKLGRNPERLRKHVIGNMTLKQLQDEEQQTDKLYWDLQDPLEVEKPAQVNAEKTLRDKIRTRIQELKPDTVIDWGDSFTSKSAVLLKTFRALRKLERDLRSETVAKQKQQIESKIKKCKEFIGQDEKSAQLLEIIFHEEKRNMEKAQIKELQRLISSNEALDAKQARLLIERLSQHGDPPDFQFRDISVDEMKKHTYKKLLKYQQDFQKKSNRTRILKKKKFPKMDIKRKFEECETVLNIPKQDISKPITLPAEISNISVDDILEKKKAQSDDRLLQKAMLVELQRTDRVAKFPNRERRIKKALLDEFPNVNGSAFKMENNDLKRKLYTKLIQTKSDLRDDQLHLDLADAIEELKGIEDSQPANESQKKSIDELRASIAKLRQSISESDDIPVENVEPREIDEDLHNEDLDEYDKLLTVLNWPYQTWDTDMDNEFERLANDAVKNGTELPEPPDDELAEDEPDDFIAHDDDIDEQVLDQIQPEYEKREVIDAEELLDADEPTLEALKKKRTKTNMTNLQNFQHRYEKASHADAVTLADRVQMEKEVTDRLDLLDREKKIEKDSGAAVDAKPKRRAVLMPGTKI